MSHRPLFAFAALLLGQAVCVLATEPPPLLPEGTVRALASEVSGAAAKRNLQDLTLFHRMRGSKGFRAAAERVRDRAREYGLSEVEILELPADGQRFYGTQRSRPAWDAEFAELWEQRQEGGRWVNAERIASWESRPVVLAQDSAGGEAAAELVDVGTGASEEAYAGKDVRGKLVLASSQPERGGASRRGSFRSGGDRLLRPEPGDGLVEGGRDPGALGASRHLPGAQDLCLHGPPEAGPRLAGAAGGGPAGAPAGERQAGQHPGAYSIPRR